MSRGGKRRENHFSHFREKNLGFSRRGDFPCDADLSPLFSPFLDRFDAGLSPPGAECRWLLWKMSVSTEIEQVVGSGGHGFYKVSCFCRSRVLSLYWRSTFYSEVDGFCFTGYRSSSNSTVV
ncbi:hypothetical protein DY000_02004733 [Brassica cretica]|uniref:Uncharacterized protein n=1 Tax=Brassica cretica TaxID=69181 RepID=A0ABQ7CEZ6_BRACR|nr:hypothetical protein DY000_02004733 [Brassica cretica]